MIDRTRARRAAYCKRVKFTLTPHFSPAAKTPLPSPPTATGKRKTFACLPLMSHNHSDLQWWWRLRQQARHICYGAWRATATSRLPYMALPARYSGGIHNMRLSDMQARYAGERAACCYVQVVNATAACRQTNVARAALITMALQAKRRCQLSGLPLLCCLLRAAACFLLQQNVLFITPTHAHHHQPTHLNHHHRHGG